MLWSGRHVVLRAGLYHVLCPHGLHHGLQRLVSRLLVEPCERTPVRRDDLRRDIRPRVYGQLRPDLLNMHGQFCSNLLDLYCELCTNLLHVHGQLRTGVLDLHRKLCSGTNLQRLQQHVHHVVRALVWV